MIAVPIAEPHILILAILFACALIGSILWLGVTKPACTVIELGTAHDAPAPPDLPAGIDAERQQLGHRLAIDHAVVIIESHCALNHRDDAGANWWRLDWIETTDTDAESLQQTQHDIRRAARFLDLCGLLDILFGDTRIVRIRRECLP